MSAPRLTSIVMVTYHTGQALEAAVEAALVQNADVELVLVNNGNPPDIEADMMARFKDEPLVRLLTAHGNIGLARAYNLGARMAQGERLLFLAPDAVIQPDVVAHLLRQEEHCKRPFAIGVRQLGEDGLDLKGSRRAILTPASAVAELLTPFGFLKHKRINQHEKPLPKNLAPVAALSRSFLYIAREDYLACPFDERFFLDGADFDFSLRFRLAGGTLYFDPDCAVTRVREPSTLPVWPRERLAAQGLALYFRKHFRRSALSVPLLWLLEAGLHARAVARTIVRARS